VYFSKTMKANVYNREETEMLILMEKCVSFTKTSLLIIVTGITIDD